MFQLLKERGIVDNDTTVLARRSFTMLSFVFGSSLRNMVSFACPEKVTQRMSSTDEEQLFC